LAPTGVPSAGGGEGGRSEAPVAGPTTPVGASPIGGGGGMSSVKPVDEKVMRPDSKVETLDVLAPSNYCPLPIHAQPDNRPPLPQADQLELPSYSTANPSFVYPVMANVYGVEGKLIVRVQVLADGTPGQMLLKQSSGNGILDRDAKEQLARWRFNPARKNGQAVTAWVDVPVTYRLPEGRK
jgi:protein TonB